VGDKFKVDVSDNRVAIYGPIGLISTTMGDFSPICNMLEAKYQIPEPEPLRPETETLDAVYEQLVSTGSAQGEGGRVVIAVKLEVLRILVAAGVAQSKAGSGMSRLWKFRHNM
jgi:hypothetical protein